MKPDGKFQAIFNPYTKDLLVVYGESIEENRFEELDEWFEVWRTENEDETNFLHIHLHYEESLQLLVYPRTFLKGADLTTNGDFNEKQGTYWNSAFKNTQRRIKIVTTDKQFNDAIRKLGIDESYNRTSY